MYIQTSNCDTPLFLPFKIPQPNWYWWAYLASDLNMTWTWHRLNMTWIWLEHNLHMTWKLFDNNVNRIWTGLEQDLNTLNLTWTWLEPGLYMKYTWTEHEMNMNRTWVEHNLSIGHKGSSKIEFPIFLFQEHLTRSNDFLWIWPQYKTYPESWLSNQPHFFHDVTQVFQKKSYLFHS